MYYDIVLSRTKNILDFSKNLGYSKVLLKSELNVVEGSLEGNRKFVENKKVDVLLNPHNVDLKDHLHFRQSGLNEIICKLAHKNNIAIAVSLDQFNDPLNLGRIMQNVRLCRKFKVVFLIVSLAKEEYDLRAPKDIEALYRIIGCSGKMIKNAWDFLKR